MMLNKRSSLRFRLLRYFQLTSLLSILVVAVLILFFYRYMVVNTITELGEIMDMSVARTALISIEDDLSVYLSHLERGASDSQERARLEARAAGAIENLIHGAGIVRVKVYARDGTVIYSTNRAQVGRSQSDNPGFTQAIKGGVASKLVYRDRFNPFDAETSDDNLIQTYLPIADTDSRQPIGVFEIYSDANTLVREAERTQLIVVPVVLGILLFLYLILLATVRRAQSLLEQQAQIIDERTQTLEILSAKLLKAQEDERKRLATTLHEGVAQSLMAIKLGLENRRDGDAADSTLPLVQLIQDAIVQIRELAMDLRPSTLDDFGALDALAGFFRELSASQSKVALKWTFDIEEQALPRPLKTIVFRIAQDTLLSLVKETEADKITVTLAARGHAVELTIAENAYSYSSNAVDPDSGLAPNEAIIPMRERALLSGGEFHKERGADGSTRNVAAWPV